MTTIENVADQQPSEIEAPERTNSRYNLRSRIKSTKKGAFNAKHYLFHTIKNSKKYENAKRNFYSRNISNAIKNIDEGKEMDIMTVQRDKAKVCMTQMHASKGINK